MQETEREIFHQLQEKGDAPETPEDIPAFLRAEIQRRWAPVDSEHAHGGDHSEKHLQNRQDSGLEDDATTPEHASKEDLSAPIAIIKAESISKDLDQGKQA